MNENNFRINSGQCVVSDGTLYIDNSISGFIRRVYEGSKSLFAIGTLISIWIPISVVFDSGIFSRELALGVLIPGIIIGGCIGILWFSSVNHGTLTRDRTIPLTAIESVDCSEDTLFPRMVIHYQKNTNEVNRIIQFPYSWFSYTDKEFNKAKNILKEEGVVVNE